MKRTSIKKLLLKYQKNNHQDFSNQSNKASNGENRPVEEEVEICGWVRTRRDSKGEFSFIQINDGSCFSNIQVIADEKLSNYQKEIKKLHPGSSCKVLGRVIQSLGKGQKIEIHAEKIEVYGFANPDEYIIGKQRVSFEKLREIAHLRPRTNTFGSVTRVRNALAKATHDFFQERDFYYINTPIITASDCEGAGEMFQVSTLSPEAIKNSYKGEKDLSTLYAQDFFHSKTYLTVSGQLTGEAYACSLGNIYTFGPTFRAENSNTSRHLAEFWMIEPEMAFADLQDNIVLAESYLKHLIGTVLSQCSEDLDFFAQRIEAGLIEKLKKVEKNKFQIISYTEVVKLLEQTKKIFEHSIAWGKDLQTEHERFLTEEIFKGPVIVIDYPSEIKAFYMKQNSEKTVAAMDVLVPEVGEIIGGSQREDNLVLLENKIISMGHRLEDYQWYLDLRRFGNVPHAGFGLGLERLVQFCTGMNNIRDVIPFPRTPGNASF